MRLSEIFHFLKKKPKVIYHTGAWSGNFGDSILQQSAKRHLCGISRFEIEFRYVNCQQTEFDKVLIDEINEQGDLLLIGGGGLVFYRPQDNSKSGWQWNIDINQLERIKVPFAVYGVGFNQFEYDTSNFLPVTNSHLQKTVELSALFSVRNQGSKRQLVARGCDESKILVVPDSGMFLPPQKISIPKLDHTKFKIGFNWTTDRENQTFPAPYQENRDKFIEACIEVLNHATHYHNAQIFFIGHMGKEFDKDIINSLKAGLTLDPVVIDEVLEHIYPPAGANAGYLVDIYRQMDLVLGMRGHANIVSFGQNTPFIGLGSHRKLRYFLEDIGKSRYFFDVRSEGNLYSVDKMKDCLHDVMNNTASLKADLHDELVRQRYKFDELNAKVVSLLEK